MLIKFEEIYRDIDTLPEEAQILLLDFIQLLKKRYAQPESENHGREKSLKIEHFLAQVNNYSFLLPPDYKFNREEIYEQ
ncbi:hypothetical protein [Nostoc sp.]|uniref:hypothetical protein n=1 Tax=Nostoc sp. TaxID=1180 RepID=UPI002FFA0717